MRCISLLSTIKKGYYTMNKYEKIYCKATLKNNNIYLRLYYNTHDVVPVQKERILKKKGK